MAKDVINIVITGGTIDSYYDSVEDKVIPLKKSVLPQFIAGLKLDTPITFSEVCMKDSRSINSADLKKILQSIEKAKSKKIILTHGTYTMPDTARFLKANLKRKDQVIILTGSMIPLSGFTFSDAPFNLGFAIASFGTLQPGIYVSMNGQIFLPEEVSKRGSEGRFVSVFNEN